MDSRGTLGDCFTAASVLKHASFPTSQAGAATVYSTLAAGNSLGLHLLQLWAVLFPEHLPLGWAICWVLFASPSKNKSEANCQVLVSISIVNDTLFVLIQEIKRIHNL